MDTNRSGKLATKRTEVKTVSETPRAASVGGKNHPAKANKSTTGRGTEKVSC